MNPMNWHELTECQRENVVWYQPLSEAFVERHWHEFTEYQRDGVVQYQLLSSTFVECHWSELTEDQRENVVRYQPLSEAFVERHWHEFTERQRENVVWYQPLSFDWLTDSAFRANIPIHPTANEKIQRGKAYANKYNLETTDIGLYGYRNHKFGRGAFNSAIRYVEVREYRDWHCDPREDMSNSYGLGIWPIGNTRVFVKFEDFCVEVVREDGKARVWAFTLVDAKNGESNMIYSKRIIEDRLLDAVSEILAALRAIKAENDFDYQRAAISLSLARGSLSGATVMLRVKMDRLETRAE
jgi:hypothetical protein